MLKPYQNVSYVNRFSYGNKLKRFAWGCVWRLLFRLSPAYGFSWWRRWLLMLFGAKIGWPVYIHPSVRVWAPWNLEVGVGVALAESVHLYSVAPITLGRTVTISQAAFICTASHDIRSECMELLYAPIAVRDYAWIASRAFVGPGVAINEGAVVGACAVVVKDVDAWTVVVGNPAGIVGKRVLRES